MERRQGLFSSAETWLRGLSEPQKGVLITVVFVAAVTLFSVARGAGHAASGPGSAASGQAHGQAAARHPAAVSSDTCGLDIGPLPVALEQRGSLRGGGEMCVGAFGNAERYIVAHCGRDTSPCEEWADQHDTVVEAQRNRGYAVISDVVGPAGYRLVAVGPNGACFAEETVVLAGGTYLLTASSHDGPCGTAAGDVDAMSEAALAAVGR